MVKDYHKILGLRKGATKAEIKKAYREKAKKYHPDKNAHVRAAEVFILVNEAYEMLLDPKVNTANIEDEERRKRYYGTSKAGGQDFETRRKEARKRAKTNAQRSYDQFINSPIFKTAMVFNGVVDFFALFFSFLLIFAPFIAYYYAKPEDKESTYAMFVLSVIGLVFLIGYWKYIINADDDQSNS